MVRVLSVRLVASTAATMSAVPTGEDRRTRTTPATRVQSTLLVASAATTSTISIIPTGALSRRTRTASTTTMRGSCSRVVASTTAVFTIPTVSYLNTSKRMIS